MALESATHINGLNPLNPSNLDFISTGDDHIRLLKSTILSSFPAITGPVSANQDDLTNVKYLVAGGTANAITLTFNPVWTSYTAGRGALFRAIATNTGATTVNVNGLGPIVLTGKSGSPLIGGEIISGSVYHIIYDGTNFELSSAESVFKTTEIKMSPYAGTNAAMKNGSTGTLSLGTNGLNNIICNSDGTISVNSVSSTGNISANGTISAGSNLNVYGTTTLIGNLTVAGTTTLSSTLTLSNFLTLHANPTTDFHACTKQYADTLHVQQVNKSGDSMSGFLTLHANPTAPNHASNKQYVDTSITNFSNSLIQTDLKNFIKPTIAANGMIIVVNNQIFISGDGADYVGKNNGVTKGFVWLPFNNSHQIPSGTTIVDVASNGSSVLACLSNGWVYSFGFNEHGQLGHGHTSLVYNLTRIEWFVNNGISVDKVWMNSEQYTSGRNGGVSFFRGTNGGLYGCGNNTFGTLGIGNLTTTISTPTQTIGITNVVDLQVSCAANGHCLAVSSNNLKAVWHWGGNNHGQGGRGNTTNQHTPAIVYTDPTHNITKIIAVSTNFYNGTSWSGEVSSSYILAGGVIRSCGFNGSGQLGIGTTTQQTTWQTLAGSTWTDIAASGGYYTSLYALIGGDLYSCGANNYGQLGLGDTTQRTALTYTGQTGISQVIPRQFSSFGAVVCRKTNGTVIGCGYNGSGILLLSSGATTPITSFVHLAIPTHSPVKDIRLLAGTGSRTDFSIFILLENNSLYAAGANESFILSNQDLTANQNNSALSVVQFVYK